MKYPTLSIFVAALSVFATAYAQDDNDNNNNNDNADSNSLIAAASSLQAQASSLLAAASATSAAASSTGPTSICNYPGCGTQQAQAFAAATPIPVAPAAIAGMAALGYAAWL